MRFTDSNIQVPGTTIYTQYKEYTLVYDIIA